jgi:hypothetical protein
MRSKLSPVNRALPLAPVPAAADAPSTRPALTGTVTGTCWFFDPMTGEPVVGTIPNGSFTVTEFRASGGALQVTGTLTATCTADDATGPTFTQEITTTVTVAVTRAPGASRTLRLLIGAIEIDRRGLVVHTGEVVVAVTAESGSGHLLGNLLWAVGNSLSSDAPATHVADLLNQFLTISGCPPAATGTEPARDRKAR